MMKKLTVRQQVNRIVKYMDVATVLETKQGMSWYHDARMLCVELSSVYPVTLSQVSQCISVLSPQKKWETNKLEVVALFNQVFNGVKPTFGFFATHKQVQECKDIIKGKFAIPYKRTKTYSFADNIASQDSDEVTIDRHALRVAYDSQDASIDKVSPVQYREARAAYKIVADSIGLKAFEVQAITWVVYKRVVNR
jgi:hypothetical protein